MKEAAHEWHFLALKIYITPTTLTGEDPWATAGVVDGEKKEIEQED